LTNFDQFGMGLSGCFSTLASMRIPALAHKDVMNTETELEDFVGLQKQFADGLQQGRTKILKKKEMQLQVFYNLQTQRDSRTQIQEAAVMRDLTTATKADSADVPSGLVSVIVAPLCKMVRIMALLPVSIARNKV
jgi:hypothetical protein